MAATSSRLSRGLGLVLVEYEYQYEGRDGLLVSIKPNERYVLLSKTNAHWWQVRSDAGSKSFYIPAKYVKELPADFPSLLDFSDQPAPEPVPLPLPAQTPVPVSVPKLDESRTRAGDQVTIRVRPDTATRYRRNENRMSTFGVLLDVHEPPRHSTNESVADGLQDDHRDSGKSRVPSFSPADPLPGPRTHSQPIPVEMPVVPPLASILVQSSSTSEPHDNQQPMTEPEEAELSTEGSAEEEKDKESHHIYESIQDLNLDLKALCEEQAPPTTQEQSSLGPNSPIYANVSSNTPKEKKTPVNTDSAHRAVDHTPCSSGPAFSPRSPQDGWQVHTDQQSGKRFYFHPLTRQSTWSSPPPPPAQGPEPSSPLISPASSQGSSSLWEQLVDEASGRFYYYNPLTGNTSWNPPSQENLPPLPESDYPLNDQENNDVFSTKVDLTAEENKDPNGSTWRQSEMLPQRMMGNGVSEEASVRSWRHSVAEDMLSNHRRNFSDFTDVTNSQNSPESPQMLEKAGILNKTKVAENGKRIRKNWSQSWTVLHGGILTFHRDPKSAPAGNASKSSQIVPEFTVELRGSSLGWAAKDKSSKKNVLELRTRQGCEFLMQYDTESIICDWLKVIQDTIRQLEQDHLSEDDEDSDKDDTERRKTSNRNSSSGNDSEQRRVRNKLRRFLQRRPTLQSVKEKGYIRDNVFGCHLDTLCHRENSTIPKFVEKCIRTVERRGLDIDGIYRVSGNLAVIQKLRHKADHEEQLDLEDGQWEEIHVITGALKLFLRELPEPLFPFSSFNKFITAIQDPDYTQRVSYIKALVQTLPLPNHDTMELLFRHLRRVIEHRDSNRMSVQGMSIVFGPTLLRPQTESANMTMNMVFQSQIVELLLNEFLVIFPQS